LNTPLIDTALRRSALWIAAAAVVGIGCNREKPPLVQTKPPEVIVERAKSKEITEFEQFTGRTEASLGVDIRARVSGYLTKVHFKDGADVKPGDPLFDIDPRTYQAAVDQAKAALAQAQAQVPRTEREFARMEALARNTTASIHELDQARADMLAAVATVDAARAALDLAQTNLEYCKIKAPFAGRLSRRQFDPGNLVKADETLLTTLLALDPIYVTFDVDERTLLRIRRSVREGKLASARQSSVLVQVALSDEQEFTRTARIDFIDNRVEAGTGTLRVRAILNNERLMMSPGQFVRVRLAVSRPQQMVVVPEESLGSDQGRRFVFVVNDKDEIASRRIEVGPLTDGERAIRSGVAAGERVVTKGVQRVRAGIKVTPKFGQNGASESLTDEPKREGKEPPSASAKSEPSEKPTPKA
jgi:RND family efflux transporter MFP subunit